jgi:hypothetical protein
MIFGHLHDGVTLCNVFSTKFTVKTADRSA